MSDRVRQWNPPTVKAADQLSIASIDNLPTLPESGPGTLDTVGSARRLDLNKADLIFPPVRQPTMPLRRYTRRVGRVSSRPMFMTDVSPLVFKLLWTVVLIVHMAFSLNLGLVAAIYFYLLGTALLGYLTLYGIAVSTFYLPPIGVGYFVVCGIHAYYVVTMVFHSLRTQRSAFTSSQFSTRTVTTSVMRIRRLSLSALSSVEFRTQSVLERLPSPFVRMCYRFWSTLVKMYEATAMKNECYESVYVARVLIQSLLHLHQIYMGSRFLPRPKMNTTWVALYVANCWLTVLLAVVFTSNRPRTRLVSLFINLALDIHGCVVIPFIIFQGYLIQYDTTLSNFPPTLWYDDEWFIRAMNELWMLLVVSPIDFIAKLGIAYNAARGLQVVPTLIQKARVDDDIAAVSPDPDIHGSGSGTTIKPSDMASQNTERHILSSTEAVVEVSTSRRSCQSRMGMAVLVCLGGAVLGFHIQAAMIEHHHDDCHLSIFPWFAKKPACSFLTYTCQSADQVGSAEELTAFIEDHEESFVSYLSIRFCPQVEIPPQITHLNNLIGLKIYKSVIARWDHKAALTDLSHPDIRFLFLIDVQMTELPPGLQSPNFPRHLYDFEICRSNLTSLPDNLDEKWPRMMVLVLEETQFTVVPPVLTRLDPVSISLAKNKITTVPRELFANEDLHFVVLDGNPLTSLPNDAALGAKLYWLSVRSTSLTEIPDVYKTIQVSAANSLYCDRALASNTTIVTNVNCVSTPNVPVQSTTYPIELEELLNGGPPQK